MATTGNHRLRALIIVATVVAAAALAGCGGPSTIENPPGKPGEERAIGGGDAVHVAREFVGAPYRSGGTTPEGVDCSGLTFAVYRRLGVKLPRASQDQARAGEHVDRGSLREGDLVFFGSRSSVTHVGIYAGEGEFIHASTRARSVRFDRLDNKYFRNRYVGARRVL
jgi:cell wall-associated NlpC family hydrolase